MASAEITVTLSHDSKAWIKSTIVEMIQRATEAGLQPRPSIEFPGPMTQGEVDRFLEAYQKKISGPVTIVPPDDLDVRVSSAIVELGKLRTELVEIADVLEGVYGASADLGKIAARLRLLARGK